LQRKVSKEWRPGLLNWAILLHMTLANVLAMGWKLLAVPGALWNSIQLAQKARAKWEQRKGIDAPPFRQKHPRIFLASTILMLVGIAFGFGSWLTRRSMSSPAKPSPPSQASTSSPNPATPPQPAPQFVPTPALAPHVPQHSRVPKKTPPGSGTTPGVLQDGKGNNQTVIQAPIQQNSTGDCSPNIVGGANSVNCDVTPPARVIPTDQYSALRDYLAGSPATVIVSAWGNQETYDFANALFVLLKDAGWHMQDGAVRPTTATGPPWQGVTVKYRGSPLPRGQHEPIVGDTPEARLGQIMWKLKIVPDAQRSEDYSKDSIEIEVGDQPKGTRSTNGQP
jgi:hypothetical protein